MLSIFELMQKSLRIRPRVQLQEPGADRARAAAPGMTTARYCMSRHLASILAKELHSSRIDTIVGDRPIIAFINRVVKDFIFTRLYDLRARRR